MPTLTPNKQNPPWRYQILVRAVIPILLGYTFWKASKAGGSRYLSERIGRHRFFSTKTPATNKRLWVHAASVGEVLTVLPLVKSWLATSENCQVLFTTNTPTGCEVLTKQNIQGIEHQYLPIDLPDACRRFIKQANISEGWIVETEIWPWLYSLCHQAGIKITIVNGRLSNKTSKQSSGFLASSYSRALKNVRVLARTAEDEKRFIALGASPESVEVVGDLKYATGGAPVNIKPFIKQPYVLAASTHENEELQIAEAWRSANRNSTLLVIAPRHPERGIVVYNELIKKGFNVALRSIDTSPNADTKIYVVDTLGELALLYQHALGAFVGGSLIKRGGHNIIEPAQFACPTVVGPHTFNFSEIVSRMETDRAIEIAETASEVVDFLVQASYSNDTQQSMGKRAQALADADRQNTLVNYQKLLF